MSRWRHHRVPLSDDSFLGCGSHCYIFLCSAGLFMDLQEEENRNRKKAGCGGRAAVSVFLCARCKSGVLESGGNTCPRASKVAKATAVQNRYRPSRKKPDGTPFPTTRRSLKIGIVCAAACTATLDRVLLARCVVCVDEDRTALHRGTGGGFLRWRPSLAIASRALSSPSAGPGRGVYQFLTNKAPWSRARPSSRSIAVSTISERGSWQLGSVQVNCQSWGHHQGPTAQ